MSLKILKISFDKILSDQILRSEISSTHLSYENVEQPKDIVVVKKRRSRLPVFLKFKRTNKQNIINNKIGIDTKSEKQMPHGFQACNPKLANVSRIVSDQETLNPLINLTDEPCLTQINHNNQLESLFIIPSATSTLSSSQHPQLLKEKRVPKQTQFYGIANEIN
jgi:hypothetical protein